MRQCTFQGLSAVCSSAAGLGVSHTVICIFCAKCVTVSDAYFGSKGNSRELRESKTFSCIMCMTPNSKLPKADI